MFAVKHGRAEGTKHTTSLFEIMNTCERHGVDVAKAYLNTFSNGISCYTLFSNDDVTEDQWQDI